MVIYEKDIYHSNHDDCNLLGLYLACDGGTENRSCGCHSQGAVSTEDGRLQFMDDNERFLERSSHRIYDGRPACSQTSQRPDSHSIGILWQDCCPYCPLPDEEGKLCLDERNRYIEQCFDRIHGKESAQSKVPRSIHPNPELRRKEMTEESSHAITRSGRQELFYDKAQVQIRTEEAGSTAV